MKYFILFLSLVSGSLLFGQNEEQHYQMKALGINIGKLHTTMKVEGKDTWYENNTLLEVHLIFKRIQMMVENHVHYYGGQLVKAQNLVMINGKLHSTSLIEWKGDHYSISIDEEDKDSLYTPVYFSGTLMYYREPVGMTQAFSESSGLFMPIIPLQKEVYQVTDPHNNREMIRYYKNGIHTKTKITHPLLTISLIRIHPEEDLDE